MLTLSKKATKPNQPNKKTPQKTQTNKQNKTSNNKKSKTRVGILYFNKVIIHWCTEYSELYGLIKKEFTVLAVTNYLNGVISM